MTEMREIRMMNPAHPGGFVKSEIVEALDLSVTRAAEVLGVTRAALSALLNERAHLVRVLCAVFGLDTYRITRQGLQDHPGNLGEVALEGRLLLP